MSGADATNRKRFRLSVKALVMNEAGQCLVLRRSAASQNNAGLWDLPGGKCDPGETVDQTLAREVAEETGLQIRVVRVAGATQADRGDEIVAYLILEARAAGSAVRLSDEHDAYEWVARCSLDASRCVPQFRPFLAASA